MDLRPLAEPYPLLQSLRVAQTQALARDCFSAGHQGLVKPGSRQLLHAVVDAARRSGVPLLGDDAA